MHRKMEQNGKFVATVENLTDPHFQSMERYWRVYKPPGVYFPKYGRFLELFEILDFARLKPEINRLTRENWPAEKTVSRNQTCWPIGNLTLDSYNIDI